MQVLMMPDYRADNPYQSLLVEAMSSAGINVQFPQGYRRVFPIWRSIKQSKPSFGVLHLHWTNPYLKGETYWAKLIYAIKFLIDIWLVKESGVRVVWTVHNLISHDSHFPRLERWVHCQLVRKCDRIIVHHQDARAGVIKQYLASPEKISTIPHGHYRTTYDPAINKLVARQRLRLSPTDRIYLTFGMLRPYKGIETLLGIWQLGQVKKATLLIAGKPENEDYGQIISSAASQTERTILHDRYIEEIDIPIYFSAADVVVLPFKTISTSGSLLLAMSYGIPVIAPRLGGIPETLGKADWLLYDPRDDQGLLHALKDSLEVDLAALGELVKIECDQVGWDAIAKKTHQLYESVV